nr:uncharacterized protein LOC115494968 isoform X1 [Taeniopygia guttata]
MQLPSPGNGPARALLGGWSIPSVPHKPLHPQRAFISLHLGLQMWEAAGRWEFKAAAHETGSSSLFQRGGSSRQRGPFPVRSGAVPGQVRLAAAAGPPHRPRLARRPERCEIKAGGRRRPPRAPRPAPPRPPQLPAATGQTGLGPSELGLLGGNGSLQCPCPWHPAHTTGKKLQYLLSTEEMDFAIFWNFSFSKTHSLQRPTVNILEL